MSVQRVGELVVSVEKTHAFGVRGVLRVETDFRMWEFYFQQFSISLCSSSDTGQGV